MVGFTHSIGSWSGAKTVRCQEKDFKNPMNNKDNNCECEHHLYSHSPDGCEYALCNCKEFIPCHKESENDWDGFDESWHRMCDETDSYLKKSADPNIRYTLGNKVKAYIKSHFLSKKEVLDAIERAIFLSNAKGSDGVDTLALQNLRTKLIPKEKDI